MIIGSHLKASVGASAPVHHGGICRPNSVPGSLFGNAIGAGQLMAPTSGCSHRSRRPQAPRIRNWKRCFPLIPPACAPNNTRQEHRNRRQIANSQGTGASYKFLPNEPDDHAIGRSRGGLTTKIHALADQACAPVTMLLTPGQSGDNPQLLPLLDVRRSQGRTRFRLLADKAYSHPSTRPPAQPYGPAGSATPSRNGPTRSSAAKPKAQPADVRRRSTQVSTRNAIPSNAASTGSSTGAVSPPATTNTPRHSSAESYSAQ